MDARRVPGEWEEHAATLVAWPTREAVWSPWQERAVAEYTALVHTLARDEPVVVVCHPRDEPRVRGLLPEGGRLLVHPIDDGWVRDNGPFLVTGAGGARVVDFRFNSWGGRFLPYTGDDSLGAAIAAHFELPLHREPFVLEGGAISVNGAGSAVVVEECVLHPSRNGPVTRGRFEDAVLRGLGVRHVIWLPYGLVEDLANTDGHVDNVAVFTGTRELLVQTAPGGNPNHARLAANLEVLARSRLADGEPLTVRRMEHLPYAVMPDGSAQPAPYVNFALTNRGVILPSVGAPTDGEAARQLGRVFPGRKVRFTPAVALTHGGGGPHCVTLQWPAPGAGTAARRKAP
ncbi:agmatine/peptidylarginine deiminase [Streptomyces sp. NPDC050560]|uniref:agmatine/peptidylarginine deiminase n=1 Tax=Streptomyces sp. NPDC050560 TaxID=3365630 RepID=UPI0037A2E518